MLARLNVTYGWTWKHDDGTTGPFILADVERYAGMITGWTPDGRKCCRPLPEFEALSIDGQEWQPTADLLAQVPWETQSRVRIRDLPLPFPLDEDR